MIELLYYTKLSVYFYALSFELKNKRVEFLEVSITQNSKVNENRRRFTTYSLALKLFFIQKNWNV